MSENAVPPEKPLVRSVRNLAVNEFGYVPVSFILLDGEKNIWIETHTIAPTVKSVERPVRVERKSDGIHIWLSPLQLNVSTESYIRYQKQRGYLEPVVKVH